MDILERKKKLLHACVSYFEDAPCYPKDLILQLQGLYRELVGEKKESRLEELLLELSTVMEKLQPVLDAPEKILLWENKKMPSTGQYTDNSDLRFNHDPDFQPYMYPLLVAKEVLPKGAVVVCAGGDHGDCTLHEGYQTCLDFVAMGYQTFLLLNRTNHCPYTSKEAGADAARAIQMIRKHAKEYRIDENRVAFAGFSNGGLTAEACIQYYSGTQKIKDHFSEYEEDMYDAYYASPDAVICVYGPRWRGEAFDYTNVIYPPTFFAVGREDMALDNLNATLPELLAHHVEVEVHTFSGVPHGQSGVTFYGGNPYPHFQLWLPLADAFLQNVFAKSVIKKRPDELTDPEYRYDSFANGRVLLHKKKGHLPAMGWNSWNAFGSGNTEQLTKAMADAMVDLGLDKLGYQYVVLDDGCYKPTREDGRLANEPGKFPSGFRALSDYIHDKGLKFGMYNDIGTNLCAGAAVGTCGHEAVDAQSYVDWGVDFLKVDNCYYLWDNATFSDAANVKYVYAPNIRGITVCKEDWTLALSAVADGRLIGQGAEKKEDYVTGIGTEDGTGPGPSPVGAMSAELCFLVEAPCTGDYDITVHYAAATEIGCGSWLELAVGENENTVVYYDNFLPSSTKGKEHFLDSPKITVQLHAGSNTIRLMNHRRQENTLRSYAALLEGLNAAAQDHDIILSICEWGKTQPQNWGYKVGDSWRILNDITFRVGSDGDYGWGAWTDDYTPSVTSQYDKAVIMDEFAGLDKGWNDPDMLMIGMNGLTQTMSKTHMTMWCMMNAPLMLGLDLRRVKRGDELWQVIANERMISLNQDALGIPAKRIYSCISLEDPDGKTLQETICAKHPDTDYIRNHNRVDILAKPLSDGGVALSFINLSNAVKDAGYTVSAETIVKYLGKRMACQEAFLQANSYRITDFWSGETTICDGNTFSVMSLEPWDSVTLKIQAV